MKGKIALVTGAAKGLGKAFSRVLLQRGAQECLAYLNADVGRVTEKEFQKEFGANSALFHLCDVTKDADVNNLFKKGKGEFGNLDIVINNAGIMHEGNWEYMLDINLTSLIRVTNVAVETMGKCNQGNGGVIINIASAAASFADTDILKVSEDGGEVVEIETVQKNLDYADIMIPEHVAESMLILIEDETLNDDVLLVTKFGTRLIEYKERRLGDFLKSSL